MTTRTIANKKDATDFCNLIMGRKLPITVNIIKGKHRSTEQNRLQRMWINEAVEQLKDETAEEKRGYCKLHFAVPIMRNEDESFKESYDKVIRPLAYELKLLAMMIPLDFPVTRLMTTGQKNRYLDDIWHHFTELGVQLTEPEGKL